MSQTKVWDQILPSPTKNDISFQEKKMTKPKKANFLIVFVYSILKGKKKNSGVT